jgi:hypothetical protein
MSKFKLFRLSVIEFNPRKKLTAYLFYFVVFNLIEESIFKKEKNPKYTWLTFDDWCVRRALNLLLILFFWWNENAISNLTDLWKEKFIEVLSKAILNQLLKERFDIDFGAMNRIESKVFFLIKKNYQTRTLRILILLIKILVLDFIYT